MWSERITGYRYDGDPRRYVKKGVFWIQMARDKSIL